MADNIKTIPSRTRYSLSELEKLDKLRSEIVSDVIKEATRELKQIKKWEIRKYKDNAIFYNSAINTAFSVLEELSNNKIQDNDKELEKKIRNEIAQQINDRISNIIIANAAEMSLSASTPYAIGGSEVMVRLQKLIRK